MGGESYKNHVWFHADGASEAPSGVKYVQHKGPWNLIDVIEYEMELISASLPPQLCAKNDMQRTLVCCDVLRRTHP